MRGETGEVGGEQTGDAKRQSSSGLNMNVLLGRLLLLTACAIVVVAAGTTTVAAQEPEVELTASCNPSRVATDVDALITCQFVATNRGATPLPRARLMFAPSPDLLIPSYHFLSYRLNGVDQPHRSYDIVYSFGDIAPRGSSAILLEIVVRGSRRFGADAQLYQESDAVIAEGPNAGKLASPLVLDQEQVAIDVGGPPPPLALQAVQSGRFPYDPALPVVVRATNTTALPLAAARLEATYSCYSTRPDGGGEFDAPPIRMDVGTIGPSEEVERELAPSQPPDTVCQSLIVMAHATADNQSFRTPLFTYIGCPPDADCFFDAAQGSDVAAAAMAADEFSATITRASESIARTDQQSGPDEAAVASDNARESFPWWVLGLVAGIVVVGGVVARRRLRP